MGSNPTPSADPRRRPAVLPGGSLLFTAGLLSSTGALPPLWVLLVTIPIAGDQVGYAIGRRASEPEPAATREPGAAAPR